MSFLKTGSQELFFKIVFLGSQELFLHLRYINHLINHSFNHFNFLNLGFLCIVYMLIYFSLKMKMI